jgi:hypothetical protein
MTISLADLAGASNGPIGRPTMLTVGDSLMWGQGLLPEHRFREIVRRRIGEHIVELSMARSGARLHPAADRNANPDLGTFDDRVHDSLVTPPVRALYSPDAFTREVPSGVPTTLQQLRSAARILTDDSGGDPDEIAVILLDGGINDVTIQGILLPVLAYQDGFFLSNWNAWLLMMARDVVEPQMITTLTEAISLFPHATIVVNGYFPVFSYYSVATTWVLHSLGLLYLPIGTPGLGLSQALALVLANPIGLDMLASASATWQAATNFHLRRAIQTVRARHPERTVLFARSNIDHEHCLFGPRSWLWGYDSFPDSWPTSVDEAVQWYLGATPEDEVIPQRLNRCRELTSDDPPNAIMCRLASIGHPNITGAADYAKAIIEVMEDEGIIDSDLHRCEQARRERARACTSFTETGEYACLRAHAAIGDTCRTWTTQLFSVAGSLFERAGERLAAAGAAVANIPDCFDSTEADLQACEVTRATEVANCNAAYIARRDGPCNITCTAFGNCNGQCNIICNSFTNCDNQYGPADPRRYACRTARAACVAAAAVSRAACMASCTAARAACVAAAAAARAACIAAAATVRAACMAAAIAKEVVCKASVVTGDVGCAAGQAATAVAQIAVAAGTAIAGVAVGLGAVVVAVGCRIAGWLVNRGCRLGVWVGGAGCRVGAGILDSLCFISRITELGSDER